MKKENEAVLTDDNVIYLEEIDYIDEISEDEKALNDLISAAVRKNLTKNFNQPELLKDQKFVQNVEKEVKRRVNLDSCKGSFDKHKDQLTEITNSVAYNVLRYRYKLQPDQNYKDEKLSTVKSVFDQTSLRTRTMPTAGGIKSVSLPAEISGLIF